MQVEIGKPVFGIGGAKLGEVDGLVVNAGTKRARAILAGAGFLGNQKHMVAVSAVRQADAEGLHLDTTGRRADEQSPIVESEEIALEQRVPPPIDFIGAAGVGGPVVATEPNLPGRYPDEASFFQIAPIDPPTVEVISNLEENEVVLGKDTEISSSDGEGLGHAVAYQLGDMGLIDRVVCSEGRIFREQTTFSLAEIEEFGTDAVHVRMTKAEAEARG